MNLLMLSLQYTVKLYEILNLGGKVSVYKKIRIVNWRCMADDGEMGVQIWKSMADLKSWGKI